MGEVAQIFLADGRPFRDIAADIVRLAGGQVREAYVRADRVPVELVEGPAGTFCAVEPNIFSNPPGPPPEEHAVFDGYPAMVEFWQPNKDYDRLAEVARRVFDALTHAPGAQPALLAWDLGDALAAFLPAEGVHEFPDGTATTAEDRHLWEPWAAPRA
ncbi:hypothetical protein ACIA8O_00690 [Kitasatospora sp. NPDC051853]|uniref:hypothetical protein n=1 Tax=Kitasatospora sp. NPDC051853 TaxID=3364058 RepID=UPI003798AEA4